MFRFKTTSSWDVSIADNPLAENPWFADLSIEEHNRYLTWWHKFRILSRISWMAFGSILISYFIGRYFAWNRLGMIVAFALLIIVVTRVWLRVLTCPRCGATYSGGLISILNRASFLDHCYGCDLTTKKLAELEKQAH